MYRQTNGYSCGPLSLLNAFESILGSKDINDLANYLHLSEDVYGKSRAEAIRSVKRAIGKAAGTNKINGTSLAGMKRAARYFNFIPIRYNSKSEINAWRWAVKNSKSYPVVICVDMDQHYSTITGFLDGENGGRVCLVDPDPRIEDGENGVYLLGKTELLSRWVNQRGVYRAIRISRA